MDREEMNRYFDIINTLSRQAVFAEAKNESSKTAKNESSKTAKK